MRHRRSEHQSEARVDPAQALWLDDLLDDTIPLQLHEPEGRRSSPRPPAGHARPRPAASGRREWQLN